MKITKIHYNWFYTTDGGEYYDEAEVGKKGVVEISIKYPNYIIKYECGKSEIIFNANKIFQIVEEADEGEEAELPF